MSLLKEYLEDIIFSFRKQKELAEKAFRQVADDDFFKKPGEHSNSIAIIIKHVAGNLASRWTDFLTTDGDKPWRNRDAEFIIAPGADSAPGPTPPPGTERQRERRRPRRNGPDTRPPGRSASHPAPAIGEWRPSKRMA
jgi:Protein of unknown function (DUF1572)